MKQEGKLPRRLTLGVGSTTQDTRLQRQRGETGYELDSWTVCINGQLQQDGCWLRFVAASCALKRWAINSYKKLVVNRGMCADSRRNIIQRKYRRWSFAML